ncbi:MAG: YkgJ family cysteine cluster protein [Flavobacteriales bacterium]
MKTLTQKVKAVEKLFAKLDGEISAFQKDSGLHCLAGCGECCKKPDIEATPLEFLPLALYFFDHGKAEETLHYLKQNSTSLCYVFRPHVTNFGGLCNEYPHRGLICRLFGFTARRDKEGKPELITCKLIKQHQNENYLIAADEVKQDTRAILMSNYYSRLSAIDPLLVSFFPINVAMSKALEVVMHYYAYRRRRLPMA